MAMEREEMRRAWREAKRKERMGPWREEREEREWWRGCFCLRR